MITGQVDQVARALAQQAITDAGTAQGGATQALADALAAQGDATQAIADAATGIADAATAQATADLRGTSKVIGFTRDNQAASGVQNVTGFGGTPVEIIIIGALPTTSCVSNGFCASDLTQGNTYQSYTGNVGSNAAALYFLEGSGLTYGAAVTGFSADTVELTWTRVGSTAAGTIGGYIIARF